MRSLCESKELEMQRADENWRINQKLSTKDMMIGGLKGEICEEFTVRLESTKFAKMCLSMRAAGVLINQHQELQTLGKCNVACLSQRIFHQVSLSLPLAKIDACQVILSRNNSVRYARTLNERRRP